MSQVDIKTLLEAGIHFGHKSSRWNPKMRQFIHSKRGGIHIIDLVQTAERLEQAVKFAESVAAGGKQVLFVGTKRHIAPAVRAAAESANMPHVTQRWFGGMLTNFATISQRVKRLQKLTEQLESGELAETYNKREILEFEEERDKLAHDFAGIAEMGKLPGALFVADVLTEKTAVREAKRLGIPVIAIVDTNGDPTLVDYVIPANDDAVKAVTLIAESIADGVQTGAKSYVPEKTETETKPKAKPAKKTSAKSKGSQSEKAKPQTTTKKKAKATAKEGAQ